jgi:hypothetical protein
LAKIVYFEKEEQTTLEQRKRPRSSSHEKAAGEMRKFLHQNDRFGKTGVQDTRLKVHSKSLKGVCIVLCKMFVSTQLIFCC